MIVVEWFQPAGRAYEWFGPTSDTIALVQAGGASAVASVIGDRGEPGADGANGVGVPVGGTSGQVLAKASATDYDTEWLDQTGGGGGADAPTFSGSFTALINQPVDTVVESNTITATGVDTWVWPIVARNAEVQVNAQPYDANSAIRTGDEITLRMKTPAIGDQTINAAIYGQGFTLGWSVTTTLAVFSPAELFANGEVGSWFEILPSTCFQDVAGTIPSAVGDPVARINDLSGNGNHALQSTFASQPILRQGGSLCYLEHDGVGDYLVASYGSDLANLTRAMGYRVLGADFFADDDNTVNFASLYALADGNLRWGINGAGAGNSLLASGGWDWGVDSVAVVSAHADRAFRITGSGNSASGTSAAAPAGISGATIGAAAGGLIPLQGRIYSFVDVGRVLTEEERTNLAGYIAEKSGVTL